MAKEMPAPGAARHGRLNPWRLGHFQQIGLKPGASIGGLIVVTGQRPLSEGINLLREEGTFVADSPAAVPRHPRILDSLSGAKIG